MSIEMGVVESGQREAYGRGMNNAEIVNRLFELFLAQDASATSALLADDFVFTSPQDDHLDKATYLQVCFPTADHFAGQSNRTVIEATDATVFTYYEYELHDGTRWSNMERHVIHDGLVTQVTVHFGGAL